ncbi:spondin domain-containing protein [Geothrix sp. 21YS21S-2]|uniref:spondin domain-containing protein n=1 Tax=Geothrix sp. 21YS21S-2 TaxID=3068893 RepID=UPI0027B88CB5|nr:spondin domain-containing protein [Geothrix sp. 21YS21S-2]
MYLTKLFPIKMGLPGFFHPNLSLLNRLVAVSAVLALAPAAVASELTVTVTNLTRATWFTPLLVTAHPASFAAFTEGAAASVEIQSIAEAGDTTPMQALLPAGVAKVFNPNNGPLKPGSSTTTASFVGGSGTANSQLTILGMLVPTNDGFVALNAIDIPTAPGTYTYFANAYDAGTEANDEKKAAAGGINQPGMIFPAFLNDTTGNLSSTINPAATGFANATKEGFVHIHPGIIGSAPGGPSALDNTVYRWLNPVAHIVLTVK